MNRRTFITYSLYACSAFALDTPSNIKAWHLGSYGDFYFKRMNQNLFVMHGVGQNPNDENMRFVHNVVLIEAKHGLIVIDPGSYAIGHHVLEQIKQVSSKPIIAIFNTHDHDDHWFANAILKDAYPNAKIYAHCLMKSAAEELYGGYYRHRGFTFDIAKKITFADVTLEGGDSLTIDSEKFFIQHPKNAHTNNDITITHLNSNTIVMGDVLFENTLANFGLHSSIYGNIEFLNLIDKQKEYTLYVPGHGLSGTKKACFQPYLEFMNILKNEVQKAYDAEVAYADLASVKEKIISQLDWEEITGFSYAFLERYISTLYIEMEDREIF